MNTRLGKGCRGTTKAGEPCGATPMHGSLYCMTHDPERAEERAQWRRRGGRASSTERRLSRLIQNAEALDADDVLRLLSGGVLLLMEGKLEPSHLSALASAARTIDAIRRTSEIQQRLDTLESTLTGASRSRDTG